LKSLVNFGLAESDCGVGQNRSNVPSSAAARFGLWRVTDTQSRHCEERSDEAIDAGSAATIWIAFAFAKGFGGQVAVLAMTERVR